MAEAKQRVIAAYVELAQVLTKASVAITDYATAINVASEPANIAHLVANPPLLPFFGAAAPIKGDSDDDVGDGKKRKREKKAKKVKDPNAPKRPASAYLEFQNAVRAQFREADPALAYSEVLRKIADTWSHMSADDKKHWNDITAAKTVQWEAAKAAYHPAEGADDIPVAASGAAGSSTTVGKDGKEYTGKKRGRKSNAEKAAIAAAGGADAGVLQALAAEPSKKKSKKEEKPVVVKPASSDEDEDDSSDESSSEEDDSDDDSDEEEEEVPAPKPSKSNGKKESAKPKSKKSKTA